MEIHDALDDDSPACADISRGTKWIGVYIWPAVLGE